MLRLPPDTSPILSMIGIDPGSRKLGLAILQFNALTYEIVSTDMWTMHVEKFAKDSPLTLTMGELYARLYEAKNRLIRVFEKVSPVLIATETPYFNKKFPGAYGPLVKTVTMIETAVVEYNPSMPLTYIAPATVKSRVNANTTVRDKTNVIECVRELPDLHYEGDVQFNKLDDNAVDAGAVVYGAYHNFVRERCLIT